MSENEALVIAMAERCLATIVAWDHSDRDQPGSLKPDHLAWMCRTIRQHAGDWPEAKVHRWIGFVQGAMIANRMVTLEEAKAMFREAKNAYGAKDVDLIDHLDPDSAFQLDIGGQG
jgi:hypothetical protein